MCLELLETHNIQIQIMVVSHSQINIIQVYLSVPNFKNAKDTKQIVVKNTLDRKTSYQV